MEITKAQFDELVVSRPMAETFALADNSSANFMDTLLSEGIGTRKEVRVYAMKWAISQKKYAGVSVVNGQRGLTWSKRGSAAEQAVNRILRAVFNGGEKSKKQKKTAPVRFTRAQRSACTAFLAEFPGEKLAEKIKKAKALLASLQ